MIASTVVAALAFVGSVSLHKRTAICLGLLVHPDSQTNQRTRTFPQHHHEDKTWPTTVSIDVTRATALHQLDHNWIHGGCHSSFFDHSNQLSTSIHAFNPVCVPPCHWGNVCPARARRATFLLTIPTSAPDLPSHGEAPQVDHVALHTFPLHCTPSLQSTLHNKAISVNSATPTVICIVLNKQHWSHKCGCQYIQ